ncbi:MAG: dockerin type I domain-containing protein [Candidatus Saccharimonadia bacterium]
MTKRRVAAGLILVGFLLTQPTQPLEALTSDSTIGAQLPVQTGGIEFVGEASPGALVTFTRNGDVIGTQVADGSSVFDDTFTNQSQGSATFGIFATDVSGRNTDLLTTTATILPAFTTILSGFLLPTTLRIVTNPIKRPQTEHIIGTTRQNSTVTVFFSGTKYSDSFSVQTSSDALGNWDTTPGVFLHLGNYSVSAVVTEPGGNQSPQTTMQNITVTLSADLNNDGRINLTDFSILMFYFNQSNVTKPADINDDGKVNLTDFSIMLYYWTG